MIDLDANQHMNKMANIVIGQGVFKNNFSNATKKLKSGSKKFSIPSPYFLEKDVKVLSTVFLNSLQPSRSISGNFVNHSIVKNCPYELIHRSNIKKLID